MSDINQVNQNSQVNQTEQTDKSAVADELRRIADLQQMEKQTDNKAYETVTSHAKKTEALRHEKALEQKMLKDPGTKVLSNLAKDLAALGIDLTPKSKQSGKLTSEFETMLDKMNLKDDKAGSKGNLTRDAVKMAKEDRQKHDEKEQNDTKTLINSSDVKDAMQEFSAAYAQNVLATSPDAKNRMDDAQDKLRKKGFGDKEIIALERTVKRSFRGSFLNNIQDSFCNHILSPNKTFDFVVTKRKFNNAMNDAVKNSELSGIKPDQQSVNEEMTRMGEVSIGELRDFVRDAVESKLTQRHLSGIDNKVEVKKLVDLGNKVGFNFATFLKTWEQKKLDLGLFILEVQQADKPEEQVQISIGEVSTGGVGEKHGYEMTKDEETELTINQLRAEYMKKALTGDPLSSFSFAPKIRKLQNGLIKLGLESDVFARIEQEGKALARFRTLEMLKEAMVERSTYYELSGPAFNLLKSKIKGYMSNLGRLGLTLTKEQSDMLRDEANQAMYDHTIIEIKSAQAVLENSENPSLEKKLPLMAKLVQRLKEESGFQHELGENLDDFITTQTSGDKNVKESA